MKPRLTSVTTFGLQAGPRHDSRAGGLTTQQRLPPDEVLRVDGVSKPIEGVFQALLLLRSSEDHASEVCDVSPSPLATTNLKNPIELSKEALVRWPFRKSAPLSSLVPFARKPR